MCDRYCGPSGINAGIEQHKGICIYTQLTVVCLDEISPEKQNDGIRTDSAEAQPGGMQIPKALLSFGAKPS